MGDMTMEQAFGADKEMSLKRFLSIMAESDARYREEAAKSRAESKAEWDEMKKQMKESQERVDREKKESQERADREKKESQEKYEREMKEAQEKYEREMKEFRESMKESHERADREMKEFRESMRESHERADREMKEFRENMRESHERADREMKEFRENMREIVEEFKGEMRKTVRGLSKRLGGIGNSLGTLTEALFACDLWKKLNKYGYEFEGQAPNRKFIEKGKVIAEADFFLENGEYVCLVEVKTQLTTDYIDRFLRRIGVIRAHLDRRRDKRKIIGAVAGGAVSKDFSEDVMEYAHDLGLYVFVRKGDSVAVAELPEGFKAREW
jgi:hypothetical protein